MLRACWSHSTSLHHAPMFFLSARKWRRISLCLRNEDRRCILEVGALLLAEN